MKNTISKKDKIFVAGHRGMVGSAICRELGKKKYGTIVTRSKQELNLLEVHDVASFFATEKPAVVILAAARVGGIQANISRPAEFLYENLVIQNNVIHQAYQNDVKKFVFIGSSCIYPKDCPQPMKEEYLLTGKLEPTNEGYALAKIAGLKMLEFYHRQYGMQSVSLMPCNLYGTNDSFHPEHSHVLSALIRRFIEAQEDNLPFVELWGSGIARREFMHVDDLARATVFLMETSEDPNFINAGTGTDVSIKELAAMIASEIGYMGEVRWDASMPDGMIRKCMDVTKIKALGFEPKISLLEGIRKTIKEYHHLKTLKTI